MPKKNTSHNFVTGIFLQRDNFTQGGQKFVHFFIGADGNAQIIVDAGQFEIANEICYHCMQLIIS